MSNTDGRNGRNIIVKRIEVVEGGHHGGSWKIAYADFVTAMMAFFLVMWLINATTEEQRRGIANFFNPIAATQDAPPPVDNNVQINPAHITETHSPSRAVNNPQSLPGQDIMTRVAPPTRDNNLPPEEIHSTRIVLLHGERTQPGEPPVSEGGGKGKETREKLNGAAEQIRRAIGNSAALVPIREQVSVSVGDDGLHIQIADSDHEPMFSRGSAVPTPHAAQLLKLLAPYLERLPGTLSVAGHTDAAPFRPGVPNNWSLSSDRAVAARDILVAAGFPDRRLKSVSGYADRQLFDRKDPLDPRNRRIVLVLSPDPAFP